MTVTRVGRLGNGLRVSGIELGGVMIPLSRRQTLGDRLWEAKFGVASTKANPGSRGGHVITYNKTRSAECPKPIKILTLWDSGLGGW